jgi:flagellar hook-associated protein 3 FlgL
MPSVTKGSTDKYLADLDRTQYQLQHIQDQVTSGLRVQRAADDPLSVPDILQIQSYLAQNKQLQTNLGNVKAELESSDAALQDAVKAIEDAISLAAQGASTTASAQQRSILAEQIKGLQETLVGLSQTSVNGRYVFSGDQDTQPAYQLDLSQPDGVTKLLSSPATRVIQDANGAVISSSKTAGEIFDPRNSDGTPATGNAFAALNALRVALENNDSAAISQAQSALHAADDYVNVQAVFYGNAQNRVASSIDLAQKFQLEHQTELSQLRDTDVPAAALQLTQLQTQEQASLAVQAKKSGMSLFDFLS